MEMFCRRTLWLCCVWAKCIKKKCKCLDLSWWNFSTVVTWTITTSGWIARIHGIGFVATLLDAFRKPRNPALLVFVTLRQKEHFTSRIWIVMKFTWCHRGIRFVAVNMFLVDFDATTGNFWILVELLKFNWNVKFLPFTFVRWWRP